MGILGEKETISIAFPSINTYQPGRLKLFLMHILLRNRANILYICVLFAHCGAKFGAFNYIFNFRFRLAAGGVFVFRRTQLRIIIFGERVGLNINTHTHTQVDVDVRK